MKSLSTKISAIILSLVFSVSMPVFAQSAPQLDKKQEKSVKKSSKNKRKELEKQGWVVAGSSKTLEDCLVAHNKKMELNPNLVEQEGVVNKCRSANVCKHAATLNAQTTYAEIVSAEIMGRVGQMTTADLVTADEMDKLTTAFGKRLATNLSGAFSLSFALEKDNGDGTKQYKMFFLVDQTKVAEASKTAMQKSIDEVKLASQLGDEIFKFIEAENTQPQE